jgi:exopolysaccharide biosynthesis polyprenyl glycosylphosphotransferase
VKRFQLLFTFLQLPIDLLMVILAFTLAYYVRQAAWFSPPVGYMMPFSTYFNLILVVALAWLAVFAMTGMYSLGSYYTPLQVWNRTFVGVSVSLAVFIIILFGLKEAFFSRLIAAYAWGFAILLVWFGRLLLLGLQRWLKRLKVIQHQVMIIGQNHAAEEIGQFYLSKLSVVRTMPEKELDIEKLASLIPANITDEVIVAVGLTLENNLAVINFCELHGIRFRYVPSLAELYSAHALTDTVAGHPLIELRPTPLDGWGRIIKRAFDIVLSLLGLIVLAPVMWVIAIMVRLDSPGPALYIHKRPGQFGKEFNFYKFRGMYTHLSPGSRYGGEQAERLRDELKRTRNEGAGLLFKVKNDPRVTRFGKFIRRTSLDELPQLFNVLNGEMSLVGPRPPLPDEVAQYDRQQFKRLLVKPGVTGPWQVSGRSDASFEEYLKLDMYYIEHWSLWLDIQLIFKTVWVALTGKGAY